MPPSPPPAADLSLKPPPHPLGREVTRAASVLLHPVYTQSIQCTETVIYRYIYRIGYINLSFLCTAVLVWIFHTLGTKKSRANGTWSACWGGGPGCSLSIAYGGHRAPRPPEDRPAHGRGSLCCGSGEQSGGQAEPSWAEGGGSDPPSVMWEEGRDTRQATRQVGAGEGWAGPGASRAESESAPAPSL